MGAAADLHKRLLVRVAAALMAAWPAKQNLKVPFFASFTLVI